MSNVPHRETLRRKILANLKKLGAHIFVCVYKGCRRQGAQETLKELKHTLKVRGRIAHGSVQITKVKCLGQCGRGPVVVVYPAGVWYGGVNTEGARTIVEKQIERGRVARELKILHVMKGED
ncbi:MAG: (2Fe-2S) ferredoxin domain-containing protein [Pyrinomonadaceae bacterium]|nr:(2Fe-2S) ferredoxin domain-containing protein [Pyrinomonadaceae bacterium]MDQ3134676.1 (2Fe-2S) ferredoxin domain-containing protein [Acidobacteriota bacterium]